MIAICCVNEWNVIKSKALYCYNVISVIYPWNLLSRWHMCEFIDVLCADVKCQIMKQQKDEKQEQTESVFDPKIE